MSRPSASRGCTLCAMEPQIRYCTTSDGVSIAYYAMGEGETVLIASNTLWSNIRYPVIATPEFQRGGEGIGRAMRVVRYDNRASGMSDRDNLDFSLEARLRDMEAVVTRTAPDKFALVGGAHGAIVAIEYAARNPERVSRLILIGPIVSGIQFRDRVRKWDSLRAMAGEEWGQYTLTMAAAYVGYEKPALLQELARRMRAAMDPAAVQEFYASAEYTDVTPSLSKLSMPVLVVHKETGSKLVTPEQARAVAAAIPDCQLFQLQGDIDVWTQAESDVIERFLGVALAQPELRAFVPTPAGPSPGSASGTAIILFTDIVSSTELTERMGDVAFRDASRALDAGLRAAIRDAGGAAIDGKLLGDGVLATFPSAAQAIDGARRCLTLSAASELALHIGLHAGDVIREDNNVYGGAVNIASRICGLSAPGEVLVSATVRELARTSAGVEFEDRGEHALKGIDDAVRVYAVRAGEVTT